MQTEIEAKFLGIDRDELREKLKKQGAKLHHPDRMMKRSTFDYPDARLYEIGGWVRVRDEGNKITFCYKQLNDRTLHGTKEVGVTVSDFEQTCNILKAIGMEQKSYQETRRESWRLGNTEIEIDEWPWIPPFVEIEAKDEKTIKEVSRLLDLDWSKAMHGSVETAYQAVYDVTEEEIDSWKEITFIPVPIWLEKSRKS